MVVGLGAFVGLGLRLPILRLRLLSLWLWWRLQYGYGGGGYGYGYDYPYGGNQYGNGYGQWIRRRVSVWTTATAADPESPSCNGGCHELAITMDPSTASWGRKRGEQSGRTSKTTITQVNRRHSGQADREATNNLFG